jgi:hypothetical protein
MSLKYLANPTLNYNAGIPNPAVLNIMWYCMLITITPFPPFRLQLFKRNETVLLFPGGAREALHGKGEEYKLFWWIYVVFDLH